MTLSLPTTIALGVAVVGALLLIRLAARFAYGDRNITAGELVAPPFLAVCAGLGIAADKLLL